MHYDPHTHLLMHDFRTRHRDRGVPLSVARHRHRPARHLRRGLLILRKRVLAVLTTVGRPREVSDARS